MKSSNVVMKLLAAVLWCVVSVGCVAEEASKPSAQPQEKIQMYQMYQNSGLHMSPPDMELCADFLEILNTTPYEKIYQDIFLTMFKGRGDFDALGFERIEDGEEKYGEMPVKELEMNERPENVEKRIQGFKGYKEEVGGFDYYLTHAVVFDQKSPTVEQAPEYMKSFPILFYVNKKLRPLDKRKGFDYVVMEEDMSGPNIRGYKSSGILTISSSNQLLKYKDKVYVLESGYQPGPYITKIYSSRTGCGFQLIK